VFKGVGGLFKGKEGARGVAKGPGIMGEYFGDFKGVAGAKSELHGILKIVHMYTNHWCKVSPSAWPRTLSILLEIFFMEGKKL